MHTYVAGQAPATRLKGQTSACRPLSSQVWTSWSDPQQRSSLVMTAVLHHICANDNALAGLTVQQDVQMPGKQPMRC